MGIGFTTDPRFGNCKSGQYVAVAVGGSSAIPKGRMFDSLPTHAGLRRLFNIRFLREASQSGQMVRRTDKLEKSPMVSFASTNAQDCLALRPSISRLREHY
jgi:hypothetical protein